MIYNVRGTSGSGKTHLVRQIVKHYDGTEITDEKGQIFGYRLPRNLWILGRYDDAIKGGGVDNITGRLMKRYQASGGEGNSMDAVEAQVRRWAEQGRHVLFEGLIATSVWGRWVKLAQELPMMFLFLDTPLQTCFERVLARSGGRTPKHWAEGKSDLHAKHNSTREQAASIEQKTEKLDYEIIDHKRAFEQMIEILEGAT